MSVMGGVWGAVLVALVGGLARGGAAKHFSSQWAAHIEGGPLRAQQIADRHGFTFLGEIFPDCYHLQHSSVARRSINPSNEHHDNLLSEREVKWARQQKVVSRSKRDFTKSQSLFPLNDPKWTQMWYLNRGSGLDMSVQEAWNEGVTGKGVVVTILDDGLERDHPDLLKNYDPQASYDVNNHDDDPMPRYDLIDSNRHGTRCAGEVAAVANNSLCSVGIAFNANIGGVRMLDGDVTDAVEARSLSLNPQHIDIYSASWGPDDDGKTVDGPGELAVRAFMEGVTKGRSGKGSIFIWASGNGGRDHDNCNCDGYTNSIWTLSISSATEKGFVPWYSEACSSTLATTYSSGSNGEKQVITTDLHRMCTVSHSGTSASAPLAAGICALALEANEALTWRDMQHIVVATARPANLKAPDWTTNGVGRNVSHSFGYGLMDAAAMVKLARKWRTVPEQQKCEVIANHSDKLIPAKSAVTLLLNVKECPGVNYLEHVQAKISLNSQRRGDLQIHLTSPSGTKSTLLARRPHDVSRVGFQQWPFMSVHTWGESPLGVWHLEIHNEGRFLGQLQDWNMMFYGTESAPMSAELEPRPSTNKMAPTTKKVQETTTSKPSQPVPAEVNAVFNTVREDPVSKDHGFEAINTSSANSLKCRRSTNICIGLCLILFLVQFLFNDNNLSIDSNWRRKQNKRVRIREARETYTISKSTVGEGTRESTSSIEMKVESGGIKDKDNNFELTAGKETRNSIGKNERKVKGGEIESTDKNSELTARNETSLEGRELTGRIRRGVEDRRIEENRADRFCHRKRTKHFGCFPSSQKNSKMNYRTVKFDKGSLTCVEKRFRPTYILRNNVRNLSNAHDQNMTDVNLFQCRSIRNIDFILHLAISDNLSIQSKSGRNSRKISMLEQTSPKFEQSLLEHNVDNLEIELEPTNNENSNSYYLKTRSKSDFTFDQDLVDYEKIKQFEEMCLKQINRTDFLLEFYRGIGEIFEKYLRELIVSNFKINDGSKFFLNSTLMINYYHNSMKNELKIIENNHSNINENFDDSISCRKKSPSKKQTTNNNKPNYILLIQELIAIVLLVEILKRLHILYKVLIIVHQHESNNSLPEGVFQNIPSYSQGEFQELVNLILNAYNKYNKCQTSSVLEVCCSKKTSSIQICSAYLETTENTKNFYRSTNSNQFRYIADQNCQMNDINIKHHNNFAKNYDHIKPCNNFSVRSLSENISLKNNYYYLYRKNIAPSQELLKSSILSPPLTKHFSVLSL